MAHNIFHTLRAEHDVLRSVAELVANTKGDTGYCHALWTRLKTLLVVHAEAEERALYDLLESRPEAAEVARHSRAEHETIDELIQQLDHIGYDDPRWLPTFRRLVDVNDHHLAEEERELFPVAGRAIDAAERRLLAVRYQDHYDALRAELAPALRPTTHRGVDGRTYEARSLPELRKLASARGIDASQAKSELISALRDTHAADVVRESA